MLRALDPSNVVMPKGLKVRSDPKTEQKGTIPSLAQLVMLGLMHLRTQLVLPSARAYGSFYLLIKKP